VIKNFIFDFGKVLVDYDFPKMMSSIFPDAEELMEFYPIFCSQEFRDRCDRGEQTFQEIINEYKALYPKWERQLQEFFDKQINAITGEVSGMRRILTLLHEKGYKTYGLTNRSALVYEVIEKYDILQMLDDRLISSEEHLVKPDPQIYHRLCEKYDLIIDECLFTDDRQMNVSGALAAGMDAVLFVDADQYEQELVKRGIIL